MPLLYNQLKRLGSLTFALERSLLLPALLTVLIASLLFVGQSLAQTPASETPGTEKVSITEISKKVEAAQKQLIDLKKRTGLLINNVALSEKRIVEVNKQVLVLENEVSDLSIREADLTKQIDSGESNVKELRERLGKRLDRWYVLYQRSTSMEMMLNASSINDLIRKSKYFYALAKHDHSRLLLLHKAVQDLGATKRELLDSKSKSTIKLTEQKKLSDQLKEEIKRNKILTEELRRRANDQVALLGRLRSLASSVESEVADVMVTRPQSGISSGEGQGLNAYRGRMMLPVRAQVIREFGRQRHEEFEDFLFVKGIEFAARVGDRVRAVAPGRVVFSSILPGYGSVLILDHGNRYHSLYGRIATSLRRPGDWIEEGDVIAVLGEKDSQGKNFYFELRHLGKAINPRDFLITGH